MRRLGSRTKRETSRIAPLLLGPLGIVGLFVLGASAMNACGGTQAESAPDAGLDVVDDATQVGACTLVDNTCTGARVCCGPLSGYPVDFDAGCRARDPIPISCQTPGTCQSKLPAKVSCYRRTNENGSVDVYFTSTLLPRAPGNLVECDQAEVARVRAYPRCP